VPRFGWSGRTADGKEVSGTLEAASKELLMAVLRIQHITVTSIEEGTEAFSLGAVVGRIALGLLLLGGATLMALIAKGTRIRCSRTAAAYDCTVQTTMAGVRELYTEEIRGAQKATDEKRVTSSGTNRKSSSETQRLVLSGDKATLASDWMAHPVVSCASAAKTLNDNFAKRQAESFETWQIEMPPAAVALVVGIIGLLVILSGVRRAF